jgi:hypothetical protein
MVFRRSGPGLLIITLAAMFAISSQTDAQEPHGDHASKVQALLKERRDVLATRLEILTLLVKSGRATQAGLVDAQSGLIDARDDLFAAELDLAPSQERRIEILKSRIENLKAGEEYATALKHQARATELEVLAATSRRLLVEIELERALAR